MQLCSRCKQRPATVFITRMEGDKTINDGLCLVCAKELGIKPVQDMMEHFGISDEELESVTDQLGEMMGTPEGEDDHFTPGGAPAFPFLQNLFSNRGEEKQEKQKGEKEKKEPHRSRRPSALEQYCTDLTARAREGKLTRIVPQTQE